MAQYSMKKVHKKPANITTSWEIKNIKNITKNMFRLNYGEQNEN